MSTSPALATPRASRRVHGRLLGGVAAGLAAHLGVPVRWVRAGFVLSSLVSGFGVILYAAFWMVLPSASLAPDGPPGLEAATRQGRRSGVRSRLADAGPLVALGAVGLGVALLAQQLLGGSLSFWGVVLGLVGLALLWRQADEAQAERWLDSSGRVSLARVVIGAGGVAAYARLSVGALLLLAALGLFAAGSGSLVTTGYVVVAGVIGVAGLALVAGPWLVRITGDLDEERAARVRQQERADVAAHLHDSVLQTLALIQKHAGDNRQVLALARAQERDLRGWLYGESAPAAASLAQSLREVAAEVEDAHGLPVEVVTVGDTPVTERVKPVVAAAREAMQNAVRHSGASRVDVYAEISPSAVEVFVRDRGRGFSLSDVPEDRLGVRGSIVGRMERHGGSAEVRSSPSGTEVRLRMELADD